MASLVGTAAESGDGARLADLLRRMNILSAAPAGALFDLAAQLEILDFRPRQVVYLPGDRARGVYFLASGRVKLSKVTRDGKELTLSYRDVGDLFGEGMLVGDGPREEMAEAMEQTLALVVPGEAVQELLDANAAVAAALARASLRRQRDLEVKMERLVFKDVGAKLAELLLQLAAEHGRQHRAGVALGLRITHQELANLIGSTRETVSLTLSQWRRKGYLATEGRRIILADREGLRALA